MQGFRPESYWASQAGGGGSGHPQYPLSPESLLLWVAVRCQASSLWAADRAGSSFPRGTKPRQHWYGFPHPRQPNTTSVYQRPASCGWGGSAVLRRENWGPGWWWKLPIVATTPPFKKYMQAFLHVCWAVYKKHMFSLLAKALCQFRVLLCIVVSFILALVFGFGHYVFFSSLLVLASLVFSSFICLSCSPASSTSVGDGWLVCFLCAFC